MNHVYETRFDWVRIYQTNGMKNTDGTVGVVKVNGDKVVEVVAADGGAYITPSSPQLVEAFDATGRKVGQAFVEESGFMPLASGVYIVAGCKVIVK